MTPHQKKIAAIVSKLLEWYPKNARDLPWRRTTDPYPVYVSEIMLQQTQVKAVVPFWQRWMRELPTLEALAAASSQKVHKLWEGLGYYARVRNMQKAALRIVQQHHGRFPDAYEEVLALPGIGRYTAGAICSIAFNQPTPVLDGNVIRVLTRLFGIAENPKEKKTNRPLWDLAEQLVSASTRQKLQMQVSHLNQSLMELGALVCMPRQPNCNLCPVARHCVARRDNLIDQLPNLSQRIASTSRRFIAFIVENQGRFLVRRRPAGVVNAHLWEFPNVELGTRPGQPRTAAAAARAFGLKLQGAKPLCTIKHTITRYRISMVVHRADPPVSDPIRNRIAIDAPGRRPALQGRWLTRGQLKKLPFSSAQKKIITALADAG